MPLNRNFFSLAFDTRSVPAGRERECALDPFTYPGGSVEGKYSHERKQRRACTLQYVINIFKMSFIYKYNFGKQ